jgi:hypothetical protein
MTILPYRTSSSSNDIELDDQLVTCFSLVLIVTLLVLIALFVFDAGTFAPPEI